MRLLQLESVAFCWVRLLVRGCTHARDAVRLCGAEVMVAAAEALGGSRGTVLADPGSTSVVSEERAMAAAEALEGSKRTEAVLVSDAAG